jgi:Ca-activated chloride channel family protein
VTFIWPAALLLLVLIPVGIAIDRAIARRRQRRLAAAGMAALSGPDAVAGAQGEPGGEPRREAATPGEATRGRTGDPAGSLRRRIPAALMVAGLTLATFALARPEAVVNVPRNEGIVVLAFDVSGSMAATDVAPSRMAAARDAATAFVERQPPGVIVGVVAFSDGGIAVQSPTRDRATITSAIERLSPQKGTSLGQGILVALHAVDIALNPPPTDYYSRRSPAPSPQPTPVPAGAATSAVIVLLTDGENNERPDPLDAAQEAADRGVRIDTVAIGSAEGVDLDLDGFVVHTQLDQELLDRIAETSGGTAYTAPDAEALMAVYETLDPRLIVESQKIELTGLLAAVSVVLLLGGALLSLRWLGRLP